MKKPYTPAVARCSTSFTLARAATIARPSARARAAGRPSSPAAVLVVGIAIAASLILASMVLADEDRPRRAPAPGGCDGRRDAGDERSGPVAAGPAAACPRSVPLVPCRRLASPWA